MAKTVDEALFKITPQIQKLSEICEENNAIDKELFTKYEVKRGLRDLNGKGVLAGLTNVSDVHAKEIIDGKEVPCPGSLYYRGYNIKDLVNGFLSAHHLDLKRLRICFYLVNSRQKNSWKSSTIFWWSVEHCRRISCGM